MPTVFCILSGLFFLGSLLGIALRSRAEYFFEEENPPKKELRGETQAFKRLCVSFSVCCLLATIVFACLWLFPLG